MKPFAKFYRILGYEIIFDYPNIYDKENLTNKRSYDIYKEGTSLFIYIGALHVTVSKRTG